MEAARSAGLLTIEQASAIELELSEEAAPEDAARSLVEKGLLTDFQADEVLAGRAERLLLAGRYRLEERIGSGATGAVFRAHDTLIARTVAVKVLPPERLTDEDTIARFHREARALGRLSHPAIVQAHDAGQDGDRHYLVMEYVEGTDLATRIREQGRIAPAEAADFAYQVCLGLIHAHAKGLVHRDLKPANVIVTPAGRAKILDLGLARFLQDTVSDAQLTREGVGMGTPDYAAPEQFRDAHAADPRSDVYSLGCTLYHCLAGHVPFPGTSVAAKYAAHEREEPRPIEEECRECPAGLAMVVRRMMAKKPEERFASALEAAQALGVHIAASSVALPEVQATATWHGSSLLLAKPPVPRRRLAALVGGAMLVAGLLGYFLARGHPPATQAAAPKPADRATAPPAESDVITVAKDGSGRFTTITNALAEAHPGATIRVLDDATYEEGPAIRQRSAHEGITLEAPRGATVRGLFVVGVPRVTLRGFQVRGTGQTTLVVVSMASPGVVLEDLRVVGTPETGGIAVLFAPLGANDPPIVVRHCRVRAAQVGIAVNAIEFDAYDTPRPCGRVVVIDNRLEGCRKGIAVAGSAYDVQILGNVLWGGGEWAGIETTNLLPGARDILIANNSVFEVAKGFRIWDRDVRGIRVEFRGNLLLGYRVFPDLSYMYDEESITSQGQAGDGALVARRWRMDRNWREAAQPTGTDSVARGWIPPAPGDALRSEITVLSRDATSPDFLRPVADSPLATGGVVADGLPPWAGALPPAGAEAWDWTKAWDARQARVLTVSADAKDGGRFRTIAEALAQAEPNSVVRVVDGATYREAVRLSQKSRHAGLTIEATAGATVTAPSPETFPKGVHTGWAVAGVRDVTIQGFRFREHPLGPAIYVNGDCSGTVLEDLEISEPSGIDAIRIENEPAVATAPPCVVRRCLVRSARFGIGLGFAATPGGGPRSCGRIVVEDCRIENSSKGVVLSGGLLDVAVVGNLLLGGGEMAAIEVGDLTVTSRDLLIANNTVFEAQYGFRVWDDDVHGERVELRNNLLLGFVNGGDAYVVDSGGSTATPRGPGDGARLLARWKVGRNGRETGPAPRDSFVGRGAVPAAPDDLAGDVRLLSRDRTSPDFLRPAPDAPSATKGVGSEGLPPWIGAVRPRGSPAWAWERAWEARQGAVLTVSADPSDSGRFRTVSAALDAARPGAVIRLLPGTYSESFTADVAERHAGITIEADDGAVLGPSVVRISDVPDVTLRGLHFQASGDRTAIVSVLGHSPGFRLADCEIAAKGNADFVLFAGLSGSERDRPAVVERCRLRGARLGIMVYGHTGDGSAPVPCGRIVLRDNLVRDCGLGITVQGAAHDVLVVGNRIWGGDMAGLQIANLLPGAARILFANNTAVSGSNPFRLWDGAVSGEGIVLRDNVLAPDAGGLDMFFTDSGGTTNDIRGPGVGAEVTRRWRLDRNWRRVDRPTSGDMATGWIPPSTTDHLVESLEFVSRDPDSPDFLRPAKDSPLATGGSGAADPAYPPWAGAVPPPGAPPWDWTAAWEALVASR